MSWLLIYIYVHMIAAALYLQAFIFSLYDYWASAITKSWVEKVSYQWRDTNGLW